ncbi:hypothetical protein [Variovorax rhizosphaerae]|uniref:Uncharacterized protein n=1 Tax=Variovorax rhizosphaerae TaxID=1836200 RepID=A0ABU8WJJ4_9BURK
MSYYTGDIGALAHRLPRDSGGAYAITTGSRVERTSRLDIALLLQQRSAPKARPASPRQTAQRRRAQQALARADAAIARTVPPVAQPALSPQQRAVVNGASNASMLDVVGSLIGREFAARDRRLQRLESRIAARSPQALRERARQAIQAAECALAY